MPSEWASEEERIEMIPIQMINWNVYFGQFIFEGDRPFPSNDDEN